MAGAMAQSRPKSGGEKPRERQYRGKYGSEIPVAAK
jgi:hypothetical protein